MAMKCDACGRGPKKQENGIWHGNLTIMWVKGNPEMCPDCIRRFIRYLKKMGFEIRARGTYTCEDCDRPIYTWEVPPSDGDRFAMRFPRAKCKVHAADPKRRRLVGKDVSA